MYTDTHTHIYIFKCRLHNTQKMNTQKILLKELGGGGALL